VIPLATLHVYCTNCGGGTDPITLLSLGVAVVATICAVVALARSRSEHREFLKRLRARAALRVTLTPLNSTPAADSEEPLAIMAPSGLGFEQTFQIGISNDGDSAAGPTTINVLVPFDVTKLCWCDGIGRELNIPSGPPHTSETLTRGAQEVSSRWIATELSRVSTRTPQLQFFKVGVAGDVNRLPIRIKADCDELPDDQAETIENFELMIHSNTPPYGLRDRGSVP